MTNTKRDYFQQDSAGQLDYKHVHGLPPARATFLGFGFVPVSATLRLVELGTINIFSVGALSYGHKTITHAYSFVELRISDVRVNGVPLSVGPHCESARPIRLALTGSSASTPPYSLDFGGPLTGTLTIPHFTDCGVGENLDPLFNAQISGPGNFVQLTQGKLCTPSSGFGCPPRRPRPIH